jgi:cytochrome c oxidase subunit 2
VVGRRLGRGVVVLPLVLLAAGCGGNQDVLKPHSHPEHRITTLWWVMMTGAWIGFAVIVFLLFLGWLRRNRKELPFGGGDREATILLICLGVALPIVVLTLLFVWADIFVIKSTAAPNPRTTRMTIQVIGHQWFWEVRYPGTNAVTANEIHIPVGVPVDLIATTDDVIHSFWVPELNRKIDMIPGRENRILLEADRAGRYRGQCAEFCGLQHAHMSLYVFADPPATFRAWLAIMAKPARPPTTRKQKEGFAVFMSQACSGCHQIRGTAAQGQVGPDLTHLQTRTTIAALTLRNDEANVGAWIVDPQHAKPGSKMPGFNIPGSQLDELLSYLETLR